MDSHALDKVGEGRIIKGRVEGEGEGMRLERAARRGVLWLF